MKLTLPKVRVGRLSPTPSQVFSLLCCLGLGCAQPAPGGSADTGPAAPGDASALPDTGTGTDLGTPPRQDAGQPPERDAGPARDAGTPRQQGDRRLQPGVEELRVAQTVDGEEVQRRVLVQAPANIVAGRRYPVIFFFHGRGGRPDGFVRQVRRWVDEGRFVAVLPEGLDRSWNLGPEPSEADDVAFVDAIIDSLWTFRDLDLERLFAMGNSNGSGMVQVLMAQRRHFRAAAMSASALAVDRLPGDNVRTASILQLHGTEDRTCPYDGGPSRVGHTFLAAEESAATWARVMGCPTEVARTRTADQNRRLEWSPCRGGHRVIHYGYECAGHGIPRDQEGGFYDLIIRFFEETP